MSKTIPIFFSTDNNYLPFLDVALSSLIKNASSSYEYKIIILNTGLDENNVSKIKEREKAGFEIQFMDISRQLEQIKSQLKNVYHFSVATYYRLFIASLFPQYDKVIYLDCDLVVLGDISKLYEIELGSDIIAAAPEYYVRNTQEFRDYASVALGIAPDEYVNAGVLLMNLSEYRKNHIEKQFISLLTEYSFDLLDPDQAYLNYLCFGKIHQLPRSWNTEPTEFDYNEKKDIVHYALYKKPWQYDDTIDGEYFWDYAKASPFYEQILLIKNSFGEAEMAQKEASAKEILEHAVKITNSKETFSTRLGKRVR